MPPRVDRQEPSADHPLDYQFAYRDAPGCGGLRAKTVSQVSSPVICRDAPSSETKGGCVYGALEAIEGRWYRGGSTAEFSFDLTEAQSIGAPLPLPHAVSDRRVNDLNHRITRRFFSGRLPIRLDSETHPAALDDNRLAAFRGVEQQGKSLFRGSGCISFHRRYYTMSSLISETKFGDRRLPIPWSCTRRAAQVFVHTVKAFLLPWRIHGRRSRFHPGPSRSYCHFLD
jgi:hypothetical protein